MPTAKISSLAVSARLESLGWWSFIFSSAQHAHHDEADVERERDAGWAVVDDKRFTTTSLPYVRKKIEKLGYADSVQLVPGYFQDTLEGLPGPFSFAFVDCDLKDSLVYCAETLWPRLSPGGRILFDDYTAEHFKGARYGVDEFVAARSGEIAEHGLLNRLYYVVKSG